MVRETPPEAAIRSCFVAYYKCFVVCYKICGGIYFEYTSKLKYGTRDASRGGDQVLFCCILLVLLYITGVLLCSTRFVVYLEYTLNIPQNFNMQQKLNMQQN